MDASVDHDNPNEVGWLSRHQAPTLLLSLATVAAFYLCYEIVQPFLPAICWALVLAVVAHPLHQWLAYRIRSENLSAAVAVVLVAVVLVAPMYFVAQQMVVEADKSAQILNGEATRKKMEALLHAHPQIEKYWQKMVGAEEFPADLPQQTISGLQWFAGHFSTFVLSSVMVVIHLGLSLFLLFYLFRDWRIGLRTLRSLVPLSEGETDQLFRRVADTINASVYGTLLISAVKGLIAGLGFWYFGIPTPLLWGVMTALTSVIPIVGPVMIWVPAAIYLCTQDAWGSALGLTIWCGGVVTAVDQLLYPLIMGKRLRLHSMTVFFALIGGLAFFGASGLVLGPVVLAVTAALIEIWRGRWLVVPQNEVVMQDHPG